MVVAVIGTKALWLLYAWLASAIVASYVSGRKGYGERAGLASGLILAPLGALIWLLWPAREGSDWKVIGPFGHEKLEPSDTPGKASAPADPTG